MKESFNFGQETSIYFILVMILLLVQILIDIPHRVQVRVQFFEGLGRARRRCHAVCSREDTTLQILSVIPGRQAVLEVPRSLPRRQRLLALRPGCLLLSIHNELPFYVCKPEKLWESCTLLAKPLIAYIYGISHRYTRWSHQL